MEAKQNHRLNPKEHVEEIDFSKYLTVLKRRWLPASAAFTTVVLLSGFLAALQKPSYESEGRLLLRKKDPSISLLRGSDPNSSDVGQLEALSALNTPVDTEAEVVASSPLVEETIQRLGLKDDKGAAMKPEAVLKNLSVKGIKGADVLQVSYKARSPKESADVINTLMNVYIENNLLTNRAEAKAAREFISEQLPKTETKLRQAEKNLRDFKERNKVVALTEEARASVTAMTELDGQISRAKSAFADASARSSALLEKIGVSQQEAIALNALSQSPGVQQALEEYQRVESQLASQRGRFQDDSPVVANLAAREASLKALLQERVGQVVGGRVATQNLSPSEMGARLNGGLRLDRLKETLIADLVTAEVTRRGLANQIDALARVRTTYQQRATVLPQLEQVQFDLDRQVKTSQAEYDVLVKRLQEVQIAENQNIGNARIVSPALTPEKPAASKKKLFLAAGLVMGGLLYVITAFLFDLGDRSVKTVREVRDLFRYTMLGLIPSVKKPGGLFSSKQADTGVPELPVRDDPHSLVSEAYRMLQANLKFLSPDRQLKSIVVTSSVSKEGKSTVSANLAVAMSQLGNRVLLIDADLRYPIQHHVWGLLNAQGLSDVIVGQADLAASIIEVMPNLHVLPAGAVPPNSLALVDSKRMHTLINDFAQDFDFVIVDTPPLVLVADALTLGRMTDGILLVSRPGVVDTSSSTAARELLDHSNQNVLGMVINGVILENEPDSYFHHAKVYYKDSGTTKDLAATPEVTRL